MTLFQNLFHLFCFNFHNHLWLSTESLLLKSFNSYITVVYQPFQLWLSTSLSSSFFCSLYLCPFFLYLSISISLTRSPSFLSFSFSFSPSLFSFQSLLISVCGFYTYFIFVILSLFQSILNLIFLSFPTIFLILFFNFLY